MVETRRQAQEVLHVLIGTGLVLTGGGFDRHGMSSELPDFRIRASDINRHGRGFRAEAFRRICYITTL